MKVLVLTTSYPRNDGDSAGRFVADAVSELRACGIEVDVVSPASFRHFGIAYGHGIVGNLRARPWLVLLVPLFLWNFRCVAARHRDVDVVHAHWLVSGLVAATLRRPYVVQVWGTDVEIARRAPWLTRPILRRARFVLGASEFLAEEARALGARAVRVVPTAVDPPSVTGEPEEPPHVLFAGRLSPEKGIHDFLEATEGLERVIVGGGPVPVPEGVGPVAPAELAGYYRRAAVVCVPSRREGYGMVAREAMASGRALVATAVGGLNDLVGPGVTLVPARDVAALRRALECLLADPKLCAWAGAEGRERAVREFSREAEVRALTETYRDAVRRAMNVETNAGE